MLGGGLFPGDMIEFYGKTGSGKTQLCLHLVSQFCHFNKDPSCVLYFDLKNDFNATRLYNFCDASVEVNLLPIQNSLFACAHINVSSK